MLLVNLITNHEMKERLSRLFIRWWFSEEDDNIIYT